MKISKQIKLQSEGFTWSEALTNSKFLYLILLLVILIVLFLLFWYAVPRPLISSPYSTIIESSDGKLLGARIADDGQWRFPEPDSLPAKFEKCLLEFEDNYFYYHPGINPVALGRAFLQNIRAGKIVSGGSTITMQLCRIARNGKSRTYFNKIIEMVWALNIELRFSKKDILIKYCANAPFGGNVVGLEAASWRYFNRPPEQLSWSESATLAVLPNAPSLIYPGKQDSLLLAKRDRLLQRLFVNKELDSLTFELALLEPLPEKLYNLPSGAYHLVERAVDKNKGKRIQTTIDDKIQNHVSEVVERYHRNLISNHIFNIAALVTDVRSGNVLAYIGNISDLDDREHGNHVDIIQSPRSTGSILKPFLYTAMIEEGILTPDMIIPDIPSRFGGFTPLNFSHDYDGAVPAKEALARSLNVPAVRMLKDYGIEPFYEFLKKAGMTTLIQPPGHYGLSLILGGAEVTLWDLAGMYTSLARILVQYEENDGFYSVSPFQSLNWVKQQTRKVEKEAAQPTVRAASVYQTLNALLEVKRPEDEAGWESFASARKIAWKTGTSFGFRDAWAVGVTKDFVVAIWVGNADGEGRSGLTGASCAAPVMFDIFDYLPKSNWFVQPVDELEPVELCRQSGYLPSQFCDETETVMLPRGIKVKTCPWHHLVHFDASGQFRVTDVCENPSDMLHQSWFVLPPVMEYYYKRKHPLYQSLPPFKPGCLPETSPMEMIYPREMDRVFIPKQLDETPGELLFEVAHRSPEKIIYWYIDEEFQGTTSFNHQLNLKPSPGWHTLYLTDEDGNQLTKNFMVVDKEH